MGNPSRFGKYGEAKRSDRLRRSKANILLTHLSEKRPFRQKSFFKKSIFRPAQVIIRPAKASDVHFIGQLSGELFYIYGGYKDIISQWFESGMTVTLIAVIGKRPVGFAMIAHLPRGRGSGYASELLAIGVTPEKQHKGIGEMLVREIESRANDMKLERLFLHTAKENFSAQKLFTKSGYRVHGIKEDFYPRGQDALVMSKEI